MGHFWGQYSDCPKCGKAIRQHWINNSGYWTSCSLGTLCLWLTCRHCKVTVHRHNGKMSAPADLGSV